MAVVVWGVITVLPFLLGIALGLTLRPWLWDCR